jgi:galactokinase/mevalonate kinase-like predicted kinase
VLGAGGGGFILFFCVSRERADALSRKFQALNIRELEISYEPCGSSLIYRG